jgi:hypothetical protein
MKNSTEKKEQPLRETCVGGSFFFKEQLEQEFIPAIRKMAEKERKHLEWLQKHDQSNRHIYMFTLRSACVLKHLEERLEEYIKYAEGLS